MYANITQRRIVAELLDILPADDPRAVASRRDLIWINALMLQSQLMASLLRRHTTRPPTTILELGCGDGAFMLAVARRMGWRDVRLVMIDRKDIVTAETRTAFAELGWRMEMKVADIFDWLATTPTGPFDLVCANLVLHHFDDKALVTLFTRLGDISSLFVATEPRRSAVALGGCAMLRAIGVNDVTRHDAAASVRAGFAAKELSNLWPKGRDMRFEERQMGLFTHAFVAERHQ